MPNLKTTLGHNLDKILQDKGISQTDFAKQIGVTFQAINRCINGKGGLSAKMISKFAKALDVEETDLVAVHKTPERVELSKDEWDKISQVVFQSKSSIPEDILNELSKLEPNLRDTAFEIFRTVLAGLTGPSQLLEKKTNQK